MIIQMEKSKTATEKLYAKRPLFFNLGLVLAITFCFIALEFKVYIEKHESVDLPDDLPILFMADDSEPTVQPPKPKLLLPKKPLENVNIVEAKQEFVEVDKPELVDVLEEINKLTEESRPAAEEVESDDPLMEGLLEVKPQFKNGIDGFYEYISKALKYPGWEQRNNIGGRVILSFVIERDGSLSDITVVKGVSENIDKEAIRVLKASPKWEAGRQRGQKVRVRMHIPIYFQIDQ